MRRQTNFYKMWLFKRKLIQSIPEQSFDVIKKRIEFLEMQFTDLFRTYQRQKTILEEMETRMLNMQNKLKMRLAPKEEEKVAPKEEEKNINTPKTPFD